VMPSTIRRAYRKLSLLFHPDKASCILQSRIQGVVYCRVGSKELYTAE
jgi:preprotein translocase subunit Sec63